MGYTEIGELKTHQRYHINEESNLMDVKVEVEDVNNTVETNTMNFEKENPPNIDVKNETNFNGNSF